MNKVTHRWKSLTIFVLRWVCVTVFVFTGDVGLDALAGHWRGDWLPVLIRSIIVGLLFVSGTDWILRQIHAKS
jgi:hypothetical protein